MAEMRCLFCGEIFTYPRKEKNRKFCGHSCAMKYHHPKIIAASLTPEARKKSGDALRGRGSGKGYRKFRGRHEHRVVAEMMLGRPLGSDEIVHHKDGNIQNNSPSNLELVTREEHARIHFTGVERPKVTHCKHGHELNEENTVITSAGGRRCRICQRRYDREYKRKKRHENCKVRSQ